MLRGGNAKPFLPGLLKSNSEFCIQNGSPNKKIADLVKT